MAGGERQVSGLRSASIGGRGQGAGPGDWWAGGRAWGRRGADWSESRLVVRHLGKAESRSGTEVPVYPRRTLRRRRRRRRGTRVGARARALPPSHGECRGCGLSWLTRGAALGTPSGPGKRRRGAPAPQPASQPAAGPGVGGGGGGHSPAARGREACPPARPTCSPAAGLKGPVCPLALPPTPPRSTRAAGRLRPLKAPRPPAPIFSRRVGRAGG